MSTPTTRRRQPNRGRTNDGRPNPVDIHVGGRLKLRRTLLGLSQQALGDAINLTFQQVQKYERGANRIGASRLLDFSQVLDVPVSFFFDDMPDHISRATPRQIGTTTTPPLTRPDAMTQRETLDLVRDYYAAPEELRAHIRALAKAMARTAGE